MKKITMSQKQKRRNNKIAPEPLNALSKILGLISVLRKLVLPKTVLPKMCQGRVKKNRSKKDSKECAGNTYTSYKGLRPVDPIRLLATRLRGDKV